MPEDLIVGPDEEGDDGEPNQPDGPPTVYPQIIRSKYWDLMYDVNAPMAGFIIPHAKATKKEIRYVNRTKGPDSDVFTIKTEDSVYSLEELREAVKDSAFRYISDDYSIGKAKEILFLHKQKGL